MKKAIFLSVILVFTGTVSLFAETVQLKDGSQIRGKIILMNEKNLILETGYTTLSVPREQITGIYENPVPQTQSTSPKLEEKKPLKSAVDQVQSEEPAEGPESWYLLITAGYSKTRFEKDLKLYNDWNRDLSFNLGMSAYGTLSDKFLLGGGFTAVGTVARYRGNGVNLHEKEDIVISGKIIHLDAKFFFDRIGTGLYVEGGIGFAEISVDDELKKEEVKDEERDHYSRFGVGFKWGGGFALELSKYETSFLVGINGYAIYAPGSRDKDPESPLKDLDKWGMKSTNLYIGILF